MKSVSASDEQRSSDPTRRPATALRHGLLDPRHARTTKRPPVDALRPNASTRPLGDRRCHIAGTRSSVGGPPPSRVLQAIARAGRRVAARAGGKRQWVAASVDCKA
jgi:hypothetical protein